MLKLRLILCSNKPRKAQDQDDYHYEIGQSAISPTVSLRSSAVTSTCNLTGQLRTGASAGSYRRSSVRASASRKEVISTRYPIVWIPGFLSGFGSGPDFSPGGRCELACNQRTHCAPDFCKESVKFCLKISKESPFYLVLQKNRCFSDTDSAFALFELVFQAVKTW